MASEAWVTLATNDSYAVGVLVLAHSLQAAKSTRPLVVMITNQVSTSMRSKLAEVATIQEVNVMDSADTAHLALLARPELGITFTKLHCWTLTQYTKCVFLDADTLIVQNCDELFNREELSAAPDAGWPDCFNSGVFVFRPSLETYSNVIEFAISQGSFDGGDQGLLNMFFSDWATKDIARRLPFIYNMTASAVYSYRPAYKHYGKDVRIVHFIGSPKPWQVLDPSALPTAVASEHVNQWWDIFTSQVKPQLSTSMPCSPTEEPTPALGVAAQFAKISVAEHQPGTDGGSASGSSADLSSPEQSAQRREAWERGEIDYTGKDAFDNIMDKMLKTMDSNKKA